MKIQQLKVKPRIVWQRELYRIVHQVAKIDHNKYRNEFWFEEVQEDALGQMMWEKLFWLPEGDYDENMEISPYLVLAMAREFSRLYDRTKERGEKEDGNRTEEVPPQSQ